MSAGDEMETIEMDNECGDAVESGATGTAEEVYLPGKPLEEGEELVHDSSAYHMYHAVSLYEHTVQ